MEIWKDIKGYEGHYSISNYGNVKSLERIIKNGRYGDCRIKERLLKQSLCRGYPCVNLNMKCNKKTLYIHREVAILFVDNIKKFNEVNHLDGNPKNNNYLNLEWCDRSENIKHSYSMGRNVKNSYKIKVVKIDRKSNIELEIFDSITSASKNINRSINSIKACLKGERKTCGGYIWNYG